MTGNRGLFVTIEGSEGAGKSTCMRAIGNYLQDRDIDYCATREPGGTPLAEEIRALFIKPRGESVDPLTELMLIFAARAQHLRCKILPAIEQGQWVICDRFTDATYAYQGGGRGVSIDAISTLEQLVQGDLRPDLTILLDLPVETGLLRANNRGESDRLEREQIEFFHRVRNTYLQRASAEPGRIKVVDAALPLQQVTSRIVALLDQLVEAHR